MSEKESKISVAGPAGKLEVALNLGHQEGKFFNLGCWTVICHPHPQHGGTMDNKVVTTLMRTYRDLGISTVRFNFRGVGTSEGVFDAARGELEDMLAVTQWLQANHAPAHLCLAGFSFGSSIAARALYQLKDKGQQNLRHLVLVAPPIERYAYDRDLQFPVPVCVVQGDSDERVNAEGVYRWCDQLIGEVTLIRYPESTHFFHGYLTAMKTDLSEVLAQDLKYLMVADQ